MSFAMIALSLALQDTPPPSSETAAFEAFRDVCVGMIETGASGPALVAAKGYGGHPRLPDTAGARFWLAPSASGEVTVIVEGEGAGRACLVNVTGPAPELAGRAVAELERSGYVAAGESIDGETRAVRYDGPARDGRAARAWVSETDKGRTAVTLLISR